MAESGVWNVDRSDIKSFRFLLLLHRMRGVNKKLELTMSCD